MKYEVLNRQPKPRFLPYWSMLVVFYLVASVGFRSKLEGVSAYAPYVFELVLVAASLCFGVLLPWKVLGRKRDLLIGVPAAFIAGGFVHRLALAKGIVVPFDLKGLEPVVFLTLVAPVLEEGLFRYFLWKPVEMMTNRTVALLLTTVLFSLSHFQAIFQFPPEIHPFIYYQTTYTLALGVAAGYFMWRWNSVLGAIAIHFAFNVGFYVAYCTSAAR